MTVGDWASADDLCLRKVPFRPFPVGVVAFLATPSRFVSPGRPGFG